MARYEWLVMSDCDPAHREEYNRWYDDVHIPDLLKIAGIVGARRLDLSPVQPRTARAAEAIGAGGKAAQPGQRPYLAIYEFDTDDVQALMDEIARRAGTSDMEISPHMRDVATHLYRLR